MVRDDCSCDRFDATVCRRRVWAFAACACRCHVDPMTAAAAHARAQAVVMSQVSIVSKEDSDLAEMRARTERAEALVLEVEELKAEHSETEASRDFWRQEACRASPASKTFRTICELGWRAIIERDVATARAEKAEAERYRLIKQELRSVISTEERRQRDNGLRRWRRRALGAERRVANLRAIESLGWQAVVARDEALVSFQRILTEAALLEVKEQAARTNLDACRRLRERDQDWLVGLLKRRDERQAAIVADRDATFALGWAAIVARNVALGEAQDAEGERESALVALSELAHVVRRSFDLIRESGQEAIGSRLEEAFAELDAQRTDRGGAGLVASLRDDIAKERHVGDLAREEARLCELACAEKDERIAALEKVIIHWAKQAAIVDPSGATESAHAELREAQARIAQLETEEAARATVAESAVDLAVETFQHGDAWDISLRDPADHGNFVVLSHGWTDANKATVLHAIRAVLANVVEAALSGARAELLEAAGTIGHLRGQLAQLETELAEEREDARDRALEHAEYADRD